MCIIILEKNKTPDRLDLDTLKRAQEVNPDGLGAMWAENEELHTWKSLDDLGTLWDIYKDARDRELRIALHFRKTTNGNTTLENCHPLLISEGFAFMHNGTVYDAPTSEKTERSDTRWLRDEVLRYLPGDFLRRTGLRDMLLKYIGTSRLLFMDRMANYQILTTSRLTETRDGRWYSKDSDLRYILDNKKSPVIGYYGYGWDKDNERPKSSSASGLVSASSEWYWDYVVDQRKIDRKHDLNSDHDLDLVFGYADLRDDTPWDVPDFLVPCGTGYLDKAALYVGEDRLGETYGIALPSKSSADMVHGNLYQIDNDMTPAHLGLDDLDDAFGCHYDFPTESKFFRFWLPVNLANSTKDGYVMAWVYMPNPDFIQVGDEVLSGDWREYLESYSSEGDPHIEDEDVGYWCPTCKMSSVFEILNSYLCSMCHQQFEYNNSTERMEVVA